MMELMIALAVLVYLAGWYAATWMFVQINKPFDNERAFTETVIFGAATLGILSWFAFCGLALLGGFFLLMEWLEKTRAAHKMKRLALWAFRYKAPHGRA